MNGLLNCGVEVWKFDLSYQASLNAMTFSINSSSNFLVIVPIEVLFNWMNVPVLRNIFLGLQLLFRLHLVFLF